MKTRNWRYADTPVQVHEVTDSMLRDARNAANGSWLPQTVWPSARYGKDYVDYHSLVTTAWAGGAPPADAVGKPLVTVLPASYLESQKLALEAHRAGFCAMTCRLCHA